MATNLFNQYFTDPKKQYIYTNITCRGKNDSGDTNLSITDNAATISNGEDTLASLDLSSIKEYITDWRNESRIIEPYQFVYFKGYAEGLAYQRNVFAKIPSYITETEDFEYYSAIEFYVKYYKNGCSFISKIQGIGTKDKTFIEDANEQLEKHELPIELTYDSNSIILTSTVLGYDYYISSDFTTNSVKFSTVILQENSTDDEIIDSSIIESTIIDSSIIDTSTDDSSVPPKDPSTLIDKQVIYLYDYCEGYVPPKKYRNGAFRGVVIKPTYPQYDNEDIADEQKSLEIAHIQNRIEVDTPIRVQSKDGCVKFYQKTIKDVFDSYSEVGELEKFNKWRNIDVIACETDSEEYRVYNIDSENFENSGENITGLYGFVNWVQKNNKWTKFGPMYMVITPKDTVYSNYCNLISSFVIYNPNSFPVKVDCLLCS